MEDEQRNWECHYQTRKSFLLLRNHHRDKDTRQHTWSGTVGPSRTPDVSGQERDSAFDFAVVLGELWNAALRLRVMPCVGDAGQITFTLLIGMLRD